MDDDRERGDEVPYGEPMKTPIYTPTEDDARAYCEMFRANVDDLGDFLECYIDPDWISHGIDAEDMWSHYMRLDPMTLADALVEYIKECK